MAKSIDEWYSIIEAQYVTNMAAAGVTVDPSTWSQANHQRIFLYTMAIICYIPGMLQDVFKVDIDNTIAAMKPHSLQWYAEKAKAFQYGDDLVAESDLYDNAGLTDAQILAKKIVSYAAVVEQERGVRIKVAKTVSDDLGALDAGELAAFSDYMKKIKDAGVKLLITSGPADSLLLNLRIEYNPLVLNSTGARIDGVTMTPVKDAIKLHLKNLPFNGVFSVQKLVDVIQAVEGVNDLHVDQVQSKYGALAFTSIDISVIPDAGYLRIADEDLTINYIAGE
jgi:hypothetical protein